MNDLRRTLSKAERSNLYNYLLFGGGCSPDIAGRLVDHIELQAELLTKALPILNECFHTLSLGYGTSNEAHNLMEKIKEITE